MSTEMNEGAHAQPPESGGSKTPRTSARLLVMLLAVAVVVVSVAVVLRSETNPTVGEDPQSLAQDEASSVTDETSGSGDEVVAPGESTESSVGKSGGVPGNADGTTDSQAKMASPPGDVPYFPVTSNVPLSGPTTTFSPTGYTGPGPTTPSTLPQPPPGALDPGAIGATTTLPETAPTTTTTLPQPPPVPTTTTSTLPQPPPVPTTTTSTLPQPPPVPTTTTTLPQPPPVP